MARSLLPQRRFCYNPVLVVHLVLTWEWELSGQTPQVDHEETHLSIVIPAFNEEARIGPSLHRIREYLAEQTYSFEIVVVDDGSTDRTTQEAERALGGTDGRVLRYEPNRGKGHAVRYGVIRAKGRVVLFSDADLATPIEELAKLEKALGDGADIAIGSRDVPGSQLLRRQSLFREMGGKLFNRFVQLLAVPGIRDTQCGFKLFTARAARAIFPHCKIDNFSFDVEVLYLARRLGFKVAEVPVVWRHQEGSKVRVWRDGPRMLRTLIRIRMTRYPGLDLAGRDPAT